MSRLVLPGGRSARRPVTVVVPHDWDRRATGFCGVCEVPFYSDRDMRAHLRSGSHRDAIDEVMRARRQRAEKLAIFNTDPDPEVAEHMKRVGEAMLREGRMVVKKNERAGF